MSPRAHVDNLPENFPAWRRERYEELTWEIDHLTALSPAMPLIEDLRNRRFEILRDFIETVDP